MTLPARLMELKDEIDGYARGHGLDYFETIFEIVDYDRINEIAAYGGFPSRYPHWRFGMEYDQLSKSYRYGLSKIYEMVINNDPVYAYLLEGNNLVDQKTVIAHVYGHADFFKHNFTFSATNRKMVDRMANHATRVRRLIDRLGIERVETFIDVCLSIDNLIDYHGPFIRRPPAREEEDTVDARDGGVHRLPARDYMDDFINPPEFLEEQRQAREEELKRRRNLPANPQRDVLLFLMEFAPLEGWELDILNIVRTEAYYFAPQGMTKIMNEGWATYWHSRIMTEQALDPDEFLDYADSYSRVVATAPGSFNPYKVGIEIWRDIEERWNRGMFGEEWEHCSSLAERESWDRQLGHGQEKIFQVRKLYNDITFIDEFLTPELVERQQMYAFGYNPKSKRWEIDSREFGQVKTQLLDNLTNFGTPVIEVVDGNFRNAAQLLLRHNYLGIPLRLDWAEEVLRNLHRIWKRPVFIETIVEDKGRLLGFDGASVINDAWTLSEKKPT
ncbi:MAG: SpoVR family protein [Deltaproteobacteria bacterium]|nr:MAG: SpoVR family protein [Deltaproteobacteria bacterium]